MSEPSGQGELERAGVSGGRQRNTGPLQVTLTLPSLFCTDPEVYEEPSLMMDKVTCPDCCDAE